MTIRFVCPLGHPLVVPDDLAGSDGQCPICRQRLVVPVAEPGAAVPHQQMGNGAIQSAAAAKPLATAAESSGPPASLIPDALDSAPPVGLPTTSVAPPPRPSALQSLPRGYVAEPAQLRWAYTIALIAGGIAILSAWPALAALRHPPVAGWVWVVVGLSLVQVAYALWLAGLPDWSTLWIGMALGTILAALDGIGLAIAMATPVARSLPLGLDDVRTTLGTWSAALLVLHGGLAYAAGWISARWRRDYELWKRSTSPGRSPQ